MPKKPAFQLGIVLFISILSVWLLAKNIDVSVFLLGLRDMNGFWLLLAFLCIGLSWLFEALSLIWLSAHNKQRLSFKTAMHTTLIGQFFNQITPLATGGQPAQLYVLVKRGYHSGSATSLLLMKFLLFQIGLVLSFTLFLGIGYKSLFSILPSMGFFIVIGYIVHASIIIGLTLVLFHQRTARGLGELFLKPVQWFKKETARLWQQKLDQFLEPFHEQSLYFIQHKQALMVGMLYTFIQLGFFFIIPFFVFQAFSIHMSLFTSSSFHAFVMMFASIVPTPGGSGAAEMTFSAVFQSFMAEEKLILSMLFWRMITAYSAVVIGVGLTMRGIRIKRTRAKEILD
ncbi:lysylphosphatidylglycerol synthase transmembrane domain-containing protein [Shouchella miscanthi]|uniref:lysylphosphatidylglycerol synthase transmembrane domain-containing protein n=1 Tax=Shouchella miscanthi TaxID=2598861 RepID=UPI0011A07AC8|nr:lysylphosphatidylglycerol synthase transmembrane domain-containing protein [Shouchella miscanthi]